MLVRADEGQTPAQGVSGSFFASFRNLERTWLGHLASGPTTPSAPSFAAPAGSGVATGSLASSEGGTDPYFSGSVRPALPRLFRLKARVWHHNAAEPVMMVVHYDGPRKRTREDWFTLVDSFHKRFVTDIKDFKIVRRPSTSPSLSVSLSLCNHRLRVSQPLLNPACSLLSLFFLLCRA
jgi:hypothetical protein